MLQDQARVVLGGQFRGKAGHQMAGLLEAYGAQNVAGGIFAVSAVDHLWAHDADRHFGGAQDGLGHRTHQKLADGAGRVGAHDDTVDLPLAQEGENLVGGQSGPHNQFAGNAGVPHSLNQRLKLLFFSAGSGGIVVIADAGSLRCGHYQGVVGMKDDEMGAKLDGLRKSEGEGLFVGGNLGGVEDGGGFAPPWLDSVCHGNLLVVR